MSVVVMGAELPKGYDDCWYLQCDLWKDCYINGLRDDCSLRTLPEKHGRLKDSDSISAGIRDMFCQVCLCSTTSFNCQLCKITKVLCIVDSAPTIVEAEGE